MFLGAKKLVLLLFIFLSNPVPFDAVVPTPLFLQYETVSNLIKDYCIRNVGEFFFKPNSWTYTVISGTVRFMVYPVVNVVILRFM